MGEGFSLSGLVGGGPGPGYSIRKKPFCFQEGLLGVLSFLKGIRYLLALDPVAALDEDFRTGISLTG